MAVDEEEEEGEMSSLWNGLCRVSIVLFEEKFAQ